MPDEFIWFNGDIVPAGDVRISVEDRGFQFGDGVYEVMRVYGGKLFALDKHLTRLWESAVGVQITPPLDANALGGEVRRLVGVNKVWDGTVYVQLTRGVAVRNHAFPDTRPTLLCYTRPFHPPTKPGEGEGAKLLAVADDRWKRCWIKAINLLANVLAKNTALASGADEAAFVDGEVVTEGASSNIFAVINGRLITHPVGSKVLPGVTRGVVLECAAALEIPVDERPILEAEAKWADELFITSTTREIAWVARWNDYYIGQGRCGAVTMRLHEAFQKRVEREVS